MKFLTNLGQDWQILGCASGGAGGFEETRLRSILSAFRYELIPFNRNNKKKSFFECWSRLRHGGFDLFVLEGTGTAAGVAAILARILYRRPYVLSSGDAVSPFLSTRFPWGAPIFSLYEILLYRCCSGYIGWTPYLVGRALTLGAKRAVTIPGWPPSPSNPVEISQMREKIRNGLNIPDDAIVFGIAGSLNWSKRLQYCYGLELIRAAQKSNFKSYILIVGDGTGLSHLQTLAGPELGKTVFLPGRVSAECVSGYLAAMDIGCLPQSVDNIGNFRYTTKLSEYLNSGLPVAVNQTPMAYDLDNGNLWRLPGSAPWSDEFIDSLSKFMNSVTREEIHAHKPKRADLYSFNKEKQLARATAFLNDILTLST